MQPETSSFEEGARLVRRSEIGRATRILTPFGPRLICYADLTATGRYLDFVEAMMARVAPFYANTHTAISSTGRIMTGLREQARSIVRRAVGGGPDDEVVFAGSGATAAVNELVGLLGLAIAEPLDRAYGLSRGIPPAERALVLVGPYEHHSNELPWLESTAEVVEVELDAHGAIDLADLELKLRRYADRPFKVGSFSAASNVTGVLSDVPAIARLLHEHGAYACFDFAAAGPYAPIDMHPPDPAARLDAVFLSMHKFIGGPGASGVLVASRKLFRTRTPVRPGGGTVDYVAGATRDAVDYTLRLDEREESGTPAIVGDIRAGVAFLVKDMMGAGHLLSHETRLSARVIARLSAHPRIRVLGPLDLPRLGIVSFNVERLHHDFVSALLDHLFGVQNRAGCACAGPYGHRLLGIDRDRSDRLRVLIHDGVLGVKPGWVRLSLPAYMHEQDIEFIVRAVEFVAERGLDFLPAYRLGWRDGVWRHLQQPSDPEPIELTATAILDAARAGASHDTDLPIADAELFAERERYFGDAVRAADALRAAAAREPPTRNPHSGRDDVDELVWFDFVHAGW